MLLILTLIAALAAPLAFEPAPAGAVSCDPCPGATTTALNLRENPSLDADVILVMPALAELEYRPSVSQQNGFLSVTYDGVDGWAASEYLWLWPGFGTTTDALNLRTDPDLGSAVIDVIPAQTEIQILGGPRNNFLNVLYGDQSGWASLDYIVVAGAPADGSPGGEFSTGDLVVVTTDYLNYRSEPSLDGDVLEVLPGGTEGGILDGPVSADGYVWYQLGLPGYGPDGATPGWVVADYLALSSGSGGSIGVGSQVAVDTDALNLRDEPGLGGDVIGVLPTGVGGTVLEPPIELDGYTWYRVNFGSEWGAGWVAGEFLAEIGEGGFSIGDTVEVRSDGGLNYRTGPSTSDDVITVLPDGHQGTITDGPVFADGYTWWELSFEGYGPDGATPGWVAGEFLVPA